MTKDSTKGVLSVFDFVQSRKYFGLDIPVSSLTTAIQSWWAYQKYQCDKYNPNGFIQGRKSGLRLNFHQKYRIQIKKDVDGGTILQIDYWARIKKLGIAAAFITYGITAAVGCGTLSYFLIEARKFLRSFWDWFDGTYQVVNVQVLVNEEHLSSAFKKEMQQQEMQQQRQRQEPPPPQQQPPQQEVVRNRPPPPPPNSQQHQNKSTTHTTTTTNNYYSYLPAASGSHQSFYPVGSQPPNAIYQNNNLPPPPPQGVVPLNMSGFQYSSSAPPPPPGGLSNLFGVGPVPPGTIINSANAFPASASQNGIQPFISTSYPPNPMNFAGAPPMGQPGNMGMGMGVRPPTPSSVQGGISPPNGISPPQRFSGVGIGDQMYSGNLQSSMNQPPPQYGQQKLDSMYGESNHNILDEFASQMPPSNISPNSLSTVPPPPPPRPISSSSSTSLNNGSVPPLSSGSFIPPQSQATFVPPTSTGSQMQESSGTQQGPMFGTGSSSVEDNTVRSQQLPSSSGDANKHSGLGFGYTYQHLVDLDKKFKQRQQNLQQQPETGSPSN
ncbi:hypothetical protein DFA_02004 [Cavenderia fasciculata]|uniref:Uncharacterized protein n=1 Tax=Cavenderia fasciculata TaxID=261658 RepID=F4PRC0_CACFS|nr:uncharacterized protein DFA_02004 [Cavenderia fasciculata]EGG22114.1 hypothetical protein DFA_02004 [Cavenderia fasciculata]|eukprot:XP_004359965.1 hypothetical protein DFA_02004 [Cavenderia fasciculata]